VQCLADVPAPDVTVVNDEADNSGVATVAFVSDLSNGATCPEIITRTYSVTDNCGNSINVTQNITVNDTTPPTASNPAPIFVECPEDIPAPNPLVVNDEGDNCGVLNVSWSTDQVNNVLCPTITRIYLITDYCGNTTQVSQIITVTDNENPTFEVDDTLFVQGNEPPPVNFGVISNINDNCTTQPSVTLISETSQGSCPIYVNRVYRITDNCGNFVDDLHTIVVENFQSQVQANFSYSPTNVSALNSNIQFLNSSSNANSYQWYFGDGSSSTQFEPTHEFEAENCSGFSVTLIASDGNCSDTVMNVIPCSEETIFYVPNTFTPDGDNYNQTFYPVFYSGYDPFNFEMLIFNRWGELIFETHNVEIGWDGTSTIRGRKAQDGIYTWKITYKNQYSDERTVVVGHVTLIR
jgi:gliding motility-associated-like protein